jgi:hypothetical protein
MWARVVEIMLGFWLLASPFIFSSANLTIYLVFGFAIILFGFLSFWPRTSAAHFLTLIASLGLIILGYVAGHPATPSAQNQLIVGILLGMFAIIPNRTNEMPDAWHEFYEGQHHDQ